MPLPEGEDPVTTFLLLIILVVVALDVEVGAPVLALVVLPVCFGVVVVVVVLALVVVVVVPEPVVVVPPPVFIGVVISIDVHSANFTGSEFEGKYHSVLTKFLDDVDLHQTDLVEEANFSKAEFHKTSHFTTI